MRQSSKRGAAAVLAAAGVLFLSGCGAVKTTFDMVGGAGKLTFGAAKATVDLAQGSVRVAQGGVKLAKGVADLSTHAGRSAFELTKSGIDTAGHAVRFVDQVGQVSHNGRMRNIQAAQAASALR